VLNRLDQLEAKVEQLESERTIQKIKINHLEEKNSALEEKLHQISQKTSSKKAATRKPSSCLDLLDLGHTLTGFYEVLPVGSSQIASIYCDFALQPTEADFETRVGFLDVKSSSVHFFVTRTTGWNTVGTMPFDVEHLNSGGGMNLASGVFTAPTAGIYAFTFKGEGYAGTLAAPNGGYGSVTLQRNSLDVASGYSSIEGAKPGTRSTVFVQATLKLSMGDTISIQHKAGATYSTDSNDIQFVGSLIEEDLVIS